MSRPLTWSVRTRCPTGRRASRSPARVAPMTDASLWRLVLAVALVVAIWRVTRLLLIDKFPPVRWLRETFLRLGTSDDEGNLTGGVGPRGLRGLTHSIAYVWTCPWCMS